MLESVLHFSIKNRWLVVLLTVMAAAVGGYSLKRLPIDAVPDITNNQVQINAVAPSLSPVEVEKQVTFPIENALAGIPGLQSTRSLSRNGFAQVTAIFEDRVDIYFARQQVSERLGEAGESLPPGVEPIMGPIATGLGEVYMWTVRYEHPHGKGAPTADGLAGWQPDGSYLTPEGRRLTTDLERTAYLREVQDWIIRPQLKGVKDVAGVDAIGGYVKQYHVQPDPMKMFHPMAMTVIFALISAFILSMTFVPAMVAIMIRGRVTEKDMFLIRWAKAAYGPVVRWALRLRWAVVAGAVLAFAASVLLFTRLGQEFVPTLDEKDIAMHAMRIPSTSLTQSQAMQFDVERTVSQFPEVAFIFSKTGTAEMATDPMPPNVSDTFIIFKPTDQWRREAELDRLIAAKTEELEKMDAHGGDAHAHEGHGHAPVKLEGHKGKLQKLLELTLRTVPGNNYEFTQPIQMRFNELISGVRGDVAVKVYGDDFVQMQRTALAVLGVLDGIPGAADAKVEQTTGLPVMTVEIDREAIARYGLSVSDVQEVVAVAMGGREAGLVFEGDRRFDLMVRLPDSLRGRIDALEQLPIPLPASDPEPQPAHLASSRGGPGGAGQRLPGFVPLGHVARVDIAEGTNQVSRENGKRRIVVQCNVRGRDLGSFVREAQASMAAVALPPGGWLVWGGQYENLVAAKERLTIVVPICFLLIFLLLFSTFKSIAYALLVFSAVPLGLTGGILSLWVRGMPFSISAAVGFIALSGVAVLNGLVMVSFINQLRAEGLGRDDAIERGSLVRLRPVLMTALVASLGFVPMAIATGTGAEVQKPLATVVIGGLISSTLLTLVVLPALYRIFTGRESTGSPMPRPQEWEQPETGPLEVRPHAAAPHMSGVGGSVGRTNGGPAPNHPSPPPAAPGPSPGSAGGDSPKGSC